MLRRQKGTSMNNYSPQDFDIRGTVLVKYNGNAAHVTVPTGITVIGSQAFADKPTISEIFDIVSCPPTGHAKSSNVLALAHATAKS